MSELVKRTVQRAIKELTCLTRPALSCQLPDLGDREMSNFGDILLCNESVKGIAEKRRCSINPQPGKSGCSSHSSAVTLSLSEVFLTWTFLELAGQTGHLVKQLIFSRGSLISKAQQRVGMGHLGLRAAQNGSFTL